MGDDEMKEEETSNMSIIKKLREQSVVQAHRPYFYQIFNRADSPEWWYRGPCEQVDKLVLMRFHRECLRYSSFEFPIVPVIAGEVQPCCYSDLENITDFEPENMIQVTQSGRLFHGTITAGSEKRCVIVKTWDFLLPLRSPQSSHALRFCDEIELYEIASAHKYMAKLYRYCYEKRLAVVYDENFSSVLSDVLLADDFGWDERIRVATQLADLLAWLHEKGFAVGSITASCIMIDKQVNIKVFDFGHITKHLNEDSRVSVNCPIGREAPESFEGVWMMKSDVYVFGLLLVELLSKKEYDNHGTVYDPVIKVKNGEIDLLHESFKDVDSQIASCITQLACDCVKVQPDKRPTMKYVFETLAALKMSERREGVNENEAK